MLRRAKESSKGQKSSTRSSVLLTAQIPSLTMPGRGVFTRSILLGLGSRNLHILMWLFMLNLFLAFKLQEIARKGYEITDQISD